MITFLCSPNNPTGRADSPRGDRRRGWPWPPACWWSTRPTASSPRRRRWSCVRRGGPGTATSGGGADLLQDLVDGRGAPRLPGGRARGGGRPASWSPCRTTSTRPSSWPGAWPSTTADEMETRVAARERGARTDRRRLRRAAGGDAGPRTPTSSCSGPLAVEARAVWSDLLDASVLVRDCSEWPGLAGCLRVTVGLPEENDRFLAALTESLR